MFSKKKIAALTGAVCLFASAGVFAAEAPTGLQTPILSTDEDSTWLCWDRPAKGDDAQYYNIYMNGKKIGTTQTPISTWGTDAMEKFRKENAALCGDLIIYHSYEAKNLKPSTEYSFTVRAVGKDGKESKDSQALKVKTTAVPKVVNAKDFGAKGDGKTVDTKALQKAIDATPKGGVLLLPSGTFVSGALTIKSDMTLKLAKDSTLFSVNDINGFQMQSNNRYNGMLNGKKIKNFRIVGEGTIDGNGWMKNSKGYYYKAANLKREDGKKSREPDVRAYGILAKTQTEYLKDVEGRDFKNAYVGRSSTIMIDEVENLYFEGVTMQNPSLHMVVIDDAKHVAVNNVNFLTYDVNNGDVIDFTGTDYKVMNCYMDSGDDSVNFNAGIGAKAKGKPPVGDAWIFNNYTKHAHGGVTLGSHTASWIKNILGEDNIYEQTEVPFRCKTSFETGGGGYGVIFRHNVMKNIKNNAFLFTTNYKDEFAEGKFNPADAGIFYNMLIEDCAVHTTKKPTLQIYGLKGAEHHDITLRNVKIYNGVKESLKDYKNLTQENVEYYDSKGKLIEKKG